MKIKHLFLIFLAGFLLNPFFNAMLSVNAKVDIVLCLIIAFAYGLENEKMPWVSGFGFLFSLLEEVATFRFVGPKVMASIIVFLVIYYARRKFNGENPFIAILLICMTLFLYETLLWGIYFVLGGRYSMGFVMARLPGNLIPNFIICALAIYLLMRSSVRAKHKNYFN